MKQKRYKKILHLMETNPTSEILVTVKTSYPTAFDKAAKLFGKVKKEFTGVKSKSTLRRNKARKAAKGVYEKVS